MKIAPEARPCSTDGFLYDLFERRIKPHELLEEGAEEVLMAVETIDKFREILDNNNLIEER